MTEYTQISEVISGPTELFVEVLQSFHPRQHDEHMRGWRYGMFLQDCKKREANVCAAAREIIERARETSQQRADRLLAEYQAARLPTDERFQMAAE